MKRLVSLLGDVGLGSTVLIPDLLLSPAGCRPEEYSRGKGMQPWIATFKSGDHVRAEDAQTRASETPALRREWTTSDGTWRVGYDID
jgi:hypothetical protein